MKKAELQEMITNATAAALAKPAQPDVLPKPVTTGKKIQKNWRPVMMILFMVLLVNNYVIAPYLSAFTGVSVLIQFPDSLMQMMMAVTGIYVTGRSAEKGIKVWKKDPSAPSAQISRNEV